MGDVKNWVAALLWVPSCECCGRRAGDVRSGDLLGGGGEATTPQHRTLPMDNGIAMVQAMSAAVVVHLNVVTQGSVFVIPKLLDSSLGPSTLCRHACGSAATPRMIACSFNSFVIPLHLQSTI